MTAAHWKKICLCSLSRLLFTGFSNALQYLFYAQLSHKQLLVDLFFLWIQKWSEPTAVGYWSLSHLDLFHLEWNRSATVPASGNLQVVNTGKVNQDLVFPCLTIRGALQCACVEREEERHKGEKMASYCLLRE